MIVLHQQSVVVLGAMNPAIHHPAWYFVTSIINQEEFDKSLRKPVVASPALAQFSSDGFSVTCLPDRWQVACTSEDATGILKLAKATFEKLYHTPLNAYGLNHDFHAETSKPISSTLVALVQKTGLPFPPNEAGTATITYTAEVDGCTFKTVISTSPRGPNFLHIQNNAHFVLPLEKIELFDLGPLLDEAFRKNEDRSKLMLSMVINTVQGLE